MPATETVEARGITVKFGGVAALRNIDLVLRPKEILGVIGPNGAGKTTLLNVLSGFYPPASGRVYLRGVDITRMAPHRRARHGLGRSFQGTRLFSDLTVLENVTSGALAAGKSRHEAEQDAIELLERMDLADVARSRAGALPAGHQLLVGVLRALALRPYFLLLDEPAAGLDEAESEQLTVRIREIRNDFACGIVLVDHDMSVIMPVCERIQVLDHGETICVGSPIEVQSDQAVIDAYLGRGG